MSLSLKFPLVNAPRTRRSRISVLLCFCASAFLIFYITQTNSLTSISPVPTSFLDRFGHASHATDSNEAPLGGDSNALLQPKLQQPLHILLPASDPNVNLCKLLLGFTVLGYPTPTLVAWNETFDNPNMLGNGSHLAKISRALRYLNSLDKSQDDEIVLMADAYDIWMQFGPDVLLSRYHRLNKEAVERVRERLGPIAEAKGIKQKIIFAAGKRCAPNHPHTVACYPLPDSPVPKDIYGTNTDTHIGRKKYFSYRQRYLNSGYVIGPVGDMRKLFARAWQSVMEYPSHNPDDDGSGATDDFHKGSDQSFFCALFGRQEYEREYLRRQGLSYWQRFLEWRRRKTNPQSVMEGTVIDDLLDPSFIHEKMYLTPGKSEDLGIGLDYMSDLGHQTVNSQVDARWLTYKTDLEKQIDHRNDMDCRMRLGPLPPDVFTSPAPRTVLSSHSTLLKTRSWLDVPVYTHLCLGTAPVMIHHNGDKSNRERQWANMWYHKSARAIMDQLRANVKGEAVKNFKEHKKSPNTPQSPKEVGGAWSDKGAFKRWDELCSADMEGMIFPS